MSRERVSTKSIIYVTFDEIPGRSDEERMQWLKEYKAHASRPRTRWDTTKLMIRFPKGQWNEDIFRTDIRDGTQRFFNRQGYEIERRYVSQTITNERHPFYIVGRHLSKHDSEGYLTQITHFGISPHLGFTRWFEYEEDAMGKKVLTRSTTQEFTRNGLLMEPGKPVGDPHIIDLFRDVPLIRETQGHSDDFDF
jgi:hypothetical protein